MCVSGGPDWIRTSYLSIRSQSLYPDELRGLNVNKVFFFSVLAEIRLAKTFIARMPTHIFAGKTLWLQCPVIIP